MKERIPIIISLILLAGVTWILYSFWWQDRGLVKVVDEQLGISFKCPQEWREAERTQYYKYYPDANVVFIKPMSEASNFGIKIKDKKGLKELDIKGTIKELDEKLAREADGFIKISSKRIKFLAVPGFEYIFRYSVPIDFKGSKREGIQKEIVFMKDEKLYFLMFYAVPADYERDHKDFEKVVRSFRITTY